MITDYRALCAELLEATQSHLLFTDAESTTAEQRAKRLNDAMTRARTALAQPEPVGPTDEEIMELMPQQMHEDLAAAARALAEQASTISRSATGVMRIMLNRHAVDLARAVLQRWGHPTPQPIPVSERLPGAEDCDAEGRCWFGWESQTADSVIFGETLEKFGPTYPAEWVFTKLMGKPEELVGPPIAWLPAAALPLPPSDHH